MSLEKNTHQYQVTVNGAQLKAVMDKFEKIGGNTNDAVRIALNKTSRRAKTMASQEIRKEVRLKAKYVNDRIKVTRATKNKLSAAISAPSRGLLLSRFSTDTQIANPDIKWFKAPPTPPRGIRVKVSPSGSTKVFKGNSKIVGKPFYILLRNSRQIGIGGRRAKSGKAGGKLFVYHGPSLSQVFATLSKRGNQGRPILEQAGQIYEKEVIDAVRYLTTKLKPPPEE